MKLAELAKDIRFPDGPSIPTDLEITGLTEDSRRAGPGMLFAALPGVKADGMAFAKEAQAKGAAAILAGPDAIGDGLSIPVLRAGQPRQALSKMAARFHGMQPAVIAAVTGTNGKTSVTAFLRQIWAALGEDAASLGTIGIATNRGTVPLSHTTPDPVTLHKHLAELAKAGVTHLAIEASSHGLAQYRLDGVKLSAGAFTNLTRDHLDYHTTFEDYLAAKLRLFTEMLEPGQPAVVDADGPGASFFIDAARAHGLNLHTVGRAGEAIRLLDVERKGFGQAATVENEGRKLSFELPLAGDFQLSNALVAAGLARSLGANSDSVFAALANLKGARGRLDYAGETQANAPIFVDYAHTPDALAKALQALRPYAKGRLRVVFGCGGDRDRGKRPEMGREASANADVVYVTDDNPRSEDPAAIRRAILAAAPAAIEVANRATAIETAIGDLQAGDVLLVAGKGHETGQITGGEVIPFSDHETIEAALASISSASRRAGHG